MTSPFQQGPFVVLDYPIDLSAELGGDTIVGAAADTDAGLIVTIGYSGSIVIVTVSGGVPGNTYQVRLHVSSSGGAEVDETLSFYILPPTPSIDAGPAGSGQLQGEVD
jgi:hypothetical protein